MASRGGMAAALVVQVLTPVVEAFEQLGIAYCVGGSVASSHYGAPRETNDVDLIAEVRLPHVEPLVAWLQHEYFIDAEMIADAIRDAAEDGSFNLIHLATMYKVDVFVSPETPFAQLQQQRATVEALVPGGRRFVLATPEDTILAKLRWWRLGDGSSMRQWNDIVGLLQRRHATVDVDYLRQAAPLLGVADILEQALVDAGLRTP